MTAVAIGADHAGFPLKETVKVWLLARGLRVLDMGTHSTESVDYPDYAALVAGTVAAGDAARGVLVCGTGIGMAIAANKVGGIRAAQCSDVESARVSRQHNDTNVLALGARTTAPELALSILEVWLETAFDGGRHVRRIEKIAGIGRRFEAPEVIHAEAR
ncbi:MAG: ribose 5-phosphate isomerase B [Candidatus Rokubacteria bacterium]|nr:ribose 5-phosphate isomerase B [Candidatus Rokubacteria bacterium]